jgi:hypothetical protein
VDGSDQQIMRQGFKAADSPLVLSRLGSGAREMEY